MAAPAVPIDVDAGTGIWRTDGLPMILLPRHFLVNNHKAVEEALGVAAYRDILRVATDKSAFDWCTAEARTHGLTPRETFLHYFTRLSQRGWGLFTVEVLEPPHVRVRLEHSVFVLEAKQPAGRGLCYMFEGFVTGALRFVMGDAGGLACEEVFCAGGGVHDCCCFSVAGTCTGS
jgi:hypothetical protein